MRHGSVTRAASELHLTQSAVSRRVAALEERLGLRLLLRARGRIIPTPAARDYAETLRGLLQGVEAATLDLLSGGTQNSTFNLACAPTFGSRWLVPRLGRFLAKYPKVNINLISRISHFDFAAEDIHAAIYFGPTIWPDCHMRFLAGDTVVPVAAPSLARGGAIANLLRRGPLIQHTTLPNLWVEWLRAAGITIPDGHAGPQFEYYSAVIEAAVSGLGFALLPEFLIRREIDAGELVKISNLAMPCDDSYSYVFPATSQLNPNVQAFGDWLFQEMNLSGAMG